MRSLATPVNPSEAARQLGVSTKALRLYERHGLLQPARTTAGWRTYGPAELARAAEIVTLRALGFGLAQIGRVLEADAVELQASLADHQATMEAQMRQWVRNIERVRRLRSDIARGRAPTLTELGDLPAPASAVRVAFDLPWPWGGERFELREIRPLNYIIGPLGSGKTRLAQCLADALPHAVFLGLERCDRLATPATALAALIAVLEANGPAAIVVDMIEEGLDHAAQEALIARLRRRGPDARPIFMLTRSCAILDLAGVGPDEAIIFCPANHSPPTQVTPCPGAPGYEAVASCLASPAVRARTAGVVARRLRPRHRHGMSQPSA